MGNLTREKWFGAEKRRTEEINEIPVFLSKAFSSVKVGHCNSILRFHDGGVHGEENLEIDISQRE